MGYNFHALSTARPGYVHWLTQGEPGREISLAIRQLYLDIVVLRREEWIKTRETRAAAMISAFCGPHVKHPGHLGGLFTFSLGRRHQFNLAKGIKSINRGNTDVARSPWARAVLSMKLLNNRNCPTLTNTPFLT